LSIASSLWQTYAFSPIARCWCPPSPHKIKSSMYSVATSNLSSIPARAIEPEESKVGSSEHFRDVTAAVKCINGSQSRRTCDFGLQDPDKDGKLAEALQ
jgi:hypothetical protein